MTCTSRVRLWIVTSALAVAGFASSGWADPPAPGPSGMYPEDEALLRTAKSAGQAAVQWLKVKARRAQLAADDATQQAERAWQNAVDEANSVKPAPARVGVSLLSAAPAETAPANVSNAPGAAPQFRWVPIEQPTAAETPPSPPLPARVVLLVHGLDEPGPIWDELAPALAAQGSTIGYGVARFDYPDDQHIAPSADLLAAALKNLGSRGATSVDMVCHSMGGLVARDVLTRPSSETGGGGWYAGSGSGRGRLPAISRLIMVGTPNNGSPLAGLEVLAEIRENFLRWVDSDGKDLSALLGFLHDGRGDASGDLAPGSNYLKDLNSRPLPTGVAITAIVGEIGQDEGAQLVRLLDWPMARQVLGDAHVEQLAAKGKTLIDQLGDGVVPRDSAALTGVTDTVFLKGNHQSMLCQSILYRRMRTMAGCPDEPEPAPAIAVILDRLGREPAKSGGGGPDSSK